MADPEEGPADEQQPDQAALAVVARHALHDEELIAAFAGGDLEEGEGAGDEAGEEAGGEAERARALTERCSACRDLYLDIQLIDGLIRAAETAAAYGARVSAPRDFRLTADDARRLGGPVPVRGIKEGGVLERLRTALTGLARPLGASMATLGVVGLLVGSMTLGPGAMPVAVDNGAPTSGAAGELDPVGGPSATHGYTTDLSSGSTDDPERSSTGGRDSPGLSAPIVSISTVVQAGSVALLLIGIALLVIGLRGRSGRNQ